MTGALLILAFVVVILVGLLALQGYQHAAEIRRLTQAHSMDYGAFVARVVSSDALANAPETPPTPPRTTERLYFSDLPYDDAAWNEFRGVTDDDEATS